MNRRQVVIFGLAAAVAGPCFASDFEGEIVASLRAQGYGQITVEVTLLGRVKITAIKQFNHREIVINPRTGEILRDLWLMADGSVATNPPVLSDLDQNDKGKGGSSDDGSDDEPRSGGSGNSGPGEDDDSDDEPEDGSDRGSGGDRD